VVKPKWRLAWLFAMLVLWLVCTGSTPFYPLSYRLAHYPEWNTKPPVDVATGDLSYPDWFEGTWQVQTTMVEAIAPLSPDVVTPGFDGNQAALNHPVTFSARFVRHDANSRRRTPPSFNPLQGLGQLSPPAFNASFSSSGTTIGTAIVADRAFNGLNLMRATLNQMTDGMGDRLVKSVVVDADNPNRQLTRMEGDRQLVSTIVGRRTEVPDAGQFITTEVFQQVFRGISQPYVNEVETTTDYHFRADAPVPITADQVTAIYLSPRDPDYFKAGDRPVALYRYRLEFSPESV
jgi:hypothetical protein